MPLRPAVLKVAPTDTGCCIRIEGEGTMQQSPAARDVAVRTLAADPRASVVFDLSACDYLDSTFLGCLMDLYRLYGKAPAEPKRYFVAASPEKRQQLMGPTHLDRLIPMLDVAPAACGEWVTVKAETLDKKALLRHVMECHQALAEAECPLKDVFARIAQQMRAELAK